MLFPFGDMSSFLLKDYNGKKEQFSVCRVEG